MAYNSETTENGICSPFTQGSKGAPSPSEHAEKSGLTLAGAADEGMIKTKLFEPLANNASGDGGTDSTFTQKGWNADATAITGVGHVSTSQAGPGGLESPFVDKFTNKTI